MWSLRTYISISEEPWIHLHTFSKVRPGRNWWLSATHSAHFVGAKKFITLPDYREGEAGGIAVSSLILIIRIWLNIYRCQRLT